MFFTIPASNWTVNAATHSDDEPVRPPKKKKAAKAVAKKAKTKTAEEKQRRRRQRPRQPKGKAKTVKTKKVAKAKTKKAKTKTTKAKKADDQPSQDQKVKGQVEHAEAGHHAGAPRPAQLGTPVPSRGAPPRVAATLMPQSAMNFGRGLSSRHQRAADHCACRDYITPVDGAFEGHGEIAREDAVADVPGMGEVAEEGALLADRSVAK